MIPTCAYIASFARLRRTALSIPSCIFFRTSGSRAPSEHPQLLVFPAFKLLAMAFVSFPHVQEHNQMSVEFFLFLYTPTHLIQVNFPKVLPVRSLRFSLTHPQSVLAPHVTRCFSASIVSPQSQVKNQKHLPKLSALSAALFAVSNPNFNPVMSFI